MAAVSSGEAGALGLVSPLVRGLETGMVSPEGEQATPMVVVVMVMVHGEQRSGCSHPSKSAVMPLLCSS